MYNRPSSYRCVLWSSNLSFMFLFAMQFRIRTPNDIKVTVV